jgi:hypothetical protein
MDRKLYHAQIRDVMVMATAVTRQSKRRGSKL